MLIKAAINGGRSKDQHPGVPVSPQQQATDALRCLQAGAHAIHLHVRSAAGVESLDAEDVARNLSAVLSVCLRAQIGVTTGAWILSDTTERLRALTSWEVLPGFASVNFSEDGAAELAELLLSKGVEVEAGLIDAHSAQLFVKSGLIDRCLRVLIEPQEQELESALENVSEIESILESASVEMSRLLHGTESMSWPLLDAAIARGYDGRIGFEDTFNLPDGSVAVSNEELVTAALRRMRAANE